jgi:DNA-binding winged helix-turn-helix (wHTH) protein
MRRVRSFKAEPTIEFGRFRVLPERRQLLADGVPVELHARAFDLLLVLIEARGLLVGKDELLRRVWPGVIVEENNLHAQICALRKVLGCDRGFIVTDCGRGYRFAAPVHSTAQEDRKFAEPEEQLLGALNRIATLMASRDAGKRHPALEVVIRLLPAGSTRKGSRDSGDAERH